MLQMPLLCLLQAGVPATTAGIRPVPLDTLDAAAGIVALRRADVPQADGIAGIVIVHNGEPLAWGDSSGVAGEHLRFRVPPGRLAGLTAERLTAWVIAGDIAARTIADWPADASLHATIDTIGTGMRSAWIRTGRGGPVQAGDAWWLRIAGQPALRLDARFVDGDKVYCGLVPLAAGVRVRPGQRVSSWSRLGRPDGQRSAVCYLEQRGEERIAWIAAPPAPDVSETARVEVRRAGRCLADGVVEGGDHRFWYARLSAMAGGGEPAVGDDVVIRTADDLRRGRLPARVFEVRSDGCLINAGEADGLRAGQSAQVYRSATPVAAVSVVRVQREFSVIRTVGAAAEPAAGDQVWFAPPPAPPRHVGTIREVVQERMLAVDLTDQAGVPLLTPLSVADDGGTVAVAILLSCDGRRAAGFAIAESMAAPLSPGMRLLLPERGRSR